MHDMRSEDEMIYDFRFYFIKSAVTRSPVSAAQAGHAVSTVTPCPVRLSRITV